MSPDFRARRRVLWTVGSLLAVVLLVAGTWIVVDDHDNDAAEGPTDAVSIPSPSIGPPPGPTGAAVVVDFATTRSLRDVPAARTLESGRNSRPMAVEQGALRHGNPTGTDAASYIELPLPRPVTRLGLTAAFPRTGGFVAAVAFDGSVVDAMAARRTFPYAGIHFVADDHTWDLGVFDPEIGANTIARGEWTRPDGGDGPVAFEINRTGSVLTVTLPDGRRSSVADPRVGAWTGRWATWELYEPRPGVTPAAITSMWAS
ncbi:hypothetical protein [uncultured Williamsia sp.]|uniref:hypothetical protein n=1 Tax=uncultured Williamsia sp. TaxID=259311 RepID=UPI0026198A00|nr:hypothetical protein [uncultured Williamsia sp.]